MKRIPLAALAVAGLGAIALIAGQQATAIIKDTKHDLSTANGVSNTYELTAGTNGDQVCVFCHTPHAANTEAKPLWNRETTSNTYGMYNNAFSTTIDMTVDGAPGGVSAACLSCHDGTVAFDSLTNRPGSGTAATAPADWSWNGTNDRITGGMALIGTDLTNDHPISIAYDHTLDGDFRDGSTLTGVRLYSGKVECGSCHDPHDNSNGTFLRVSNAGSALCTACHIK